MDLFFIICGPLRARPAMMNEELIDETQARALRALAHLIHTVRPDWDEQGVLTKLQAATRNGKQLADLSLASLRAALDPGNRTPAVIPMEGAHWRDVAATTVPRPYAHPPRSQRGDYAGGAAIARAAFRDARRVDIPTDDSEEQVA